MPTLDATVGGASANAYALVTAADTYFDGRLQASAWTGESDEDVKERALIMAAQQIDTLRYKGFKNSSAQARQFPRENIYDRDGEPYSTTAIPQIVLEAYYETALEILNANADGTDAFANDGLERFDRAKVGKLEVEPNHSRSQAKVSDRVRRMLSHLIVSTGLVRPLERF